MPGVWAAIREHAGVGGHISMGAVPIWVACAATLVHGDIKAWTAAEGHVWVCGPNTAGDCVDALGPSCHQRPQGCLGSRLQICYLAVDWGPCQSEWPALSSRVTVSSQSGLLLRSMSPSVTPHQPWSELTSIALVPTGFKGTKRVEIQGQCWVCPTLHWPWDSSLFPSLDTAAESRPLRSEEMAPPLTMGVGELAPLRGPWGAGSTPWLRGAIPETQTDQLSYPPKPTSWDLGWHSLTSTPSMTCYNYIHRITMNRATVGYTRAVSKRI